ncbi:phage tail spike protein [Nesterenkonia lacusekhoensis]|uniref:Phage minor structural protein n=1 Tax=Nesterenkonia lacusekhoensis TaxID=150832 RepID=A0ABS4T0N1_9MICC|nr:phage tail spike protein [Nesterenkonia lacusekhoensis]MBP2317408.1 phage minor structural protein [Nesterenkonia lacusekhoensis]
MSSRPADDAIAVLNWNGTPERVIQDAHWKLEDRDDSTNQLRVTCSLAEAEGIQDEQELIFKQRRFIVQQVRRTRSDDRAEVTADEAQVELSGRVLEEFAPNAWTLEEAVQELLSGTRWTMGRIMGVRYGRAQFEDLSVLEGLRFLARHQDARLSFDSLRRRVNIAPDMGETHEIVFTYKRELTDIVKQSRAPITTVIYPTGADDMGIESVNDGVPYVEDYGYYTAQGISLADARELYRKEDRWRDQRYEVPENLKRDAEKRLQEEAYPAITYELTAAATRSSYSDDFELSGLSLGDQVYVWDDEVDAKLRAEVSVVTTSSDASENNLTLAYVPESLSERNEGTFFGDSGRPADGPNARPVDRSGPQPRPSMPILESLEAIGSGKVRWNGQDHEGNYDTIPERFGRVRTIVAALVDGVVPSPNSEDAFTGSDIHTRGGGVSTIGFGAGGEFAVWFQMVGRDGITVSEFSEPLIVPVPDLVDAEQMRADLDEAQQRIDQAQDDIDAAMGRVDEVADEWDEVDFPQLKADLEAAEQAVSEAESRLDAAEQDVAASQADLADLRENRLPALDSALDGIESAVADYDRRITNAQSAADQAQATGQHLEGEVLPALDGRLADNEQALGEAEGRLSSARGDIDNLRDVRLPGLESDLASGLEDANEWRDVGAISASSMRVGNWSNLWDDPGTDDLHERGSASPFWNLGSNWSTITDQGGMPRLVRCIEGETSFTSITEYRPTGHVNGMRVQPGQQFQVSFYGWKSSGRRIRSRARYYTETGEFAGSGVGPENYVLDDGWSSHSLTFVVPDDDSIARMCITFNADAGTGGGHYSRFQMRERVGGDLVVDGSIQARHIMAEEIAGAVGEFLNLTADQIDTENLAAYLATIIELDAGQITSGKIDTSRLNAEQVAAEVANFLALDALEINVEQLAGEIANIIEVTAESIASGAISTRHLAIGDFENLLPQQAIEDLATNGDNTAPWTRIRGNTNRWYTITGQGRGMRAIRINDGTASHARTTMEYAPGEGLGIPISGGESFRLTFYGWAGGSGAAPSISLLVRDASGSFVGRVDTVTVQSGWNEYSLEFHNDVYSQQFMRVEFDVPSGEAMRGHWQDFKFRHMTNGELIVDGSIRARHVIAEEIAGAVAQFLELHADQITAGTIDTNLLNVSDLAARIANVIQLNASRITAGQLSAARIDIDSLFADSAFVNTLRSRVIEAIQLTTERIITGDIIATGTIDVSHINVTSALTAEIARFLTVEADQIAANAIDSMTIRSARIVGADVEGSTFTGGEFRTSSNWPSSGGATMRQDGTHGNFVAADDSGTVVARLGGGRNELAYLAITGDLRMGSRSAEGGLVPDRGRLRVQGRMPFDDGTARDMFVYGLSPAFHFSGSEGPVAMWDVVYPEPRPNSNSGPVMTPLPNDSRRHLSVNTVGVGPSGFTAIFMPLYADPLAAETFRCRYVSFWRG